MSEHAAKQARYIFTVTAGHTGTAWLADFLRGSLAIEAIHEPLQIDDFGTRMPNIKVMRSFNERGNDALVRSFWSAKLADISRKQHYAETNHTLAKCGLVENLAGSSIKESSALIVLRRDLIAQCISYVTRGDFLNITINWQWYLHPSYKNVIIDPEPFVRLGQIGMAIWYTYEMDARQYYYLTKFGDRLNFIEARLEDLTTQSGAGRLLEALGYICEPQIPPPRNTSGDQLKSQVADQVARVMNGIGYEPRTLVERYRRDGKSLDLS